VVTQQRPMGARTDPHGCHQGSASGGYRLRLSSVPRDPEWDRFLLTTSAGHHLQSSYWGEVKSIIGWRAIRVLVTRDRDIYGGAQVLLRKLPVIGSVGYVPLGPVLGTDDAVLRDLVFQGLQTIVRKQRVLFLVVQPPIGQDNVAAHLQARGFSKAGEVIRVQFC
jgi:lipid II:glycine glycyltransferase (peptidoglycan interpeptide bridge formation enzyme)